MKIKKANTNFFCIKTISLPLLIIFLFNLYGHSTVNDYTPDISNPFHDVFYAYSNYNKDKAKKLLKKQFNNFFRNQAYINYGLIQEYEKNYPEAETYYRKALKNNEKVSVIYLYNLYKKHDMEKSLPLLMALDKNIKSIWIDYEIAVHYAGNNVNDKAIEYLSQAVDKGFSSAELLLSDPAFDHIRNTSSFERLIKKTKKNYKESDSIMERMKFAKYEYEKDKPCGRINDLEIAAYFEKTGRERKALNILSLVISSKQSFRDRSIAFFWLARISAQRGEKKSARHYLKEFIDHIRGQEKDDTGFKQLVEPIYTDIILNDRFLRNIAGDMIN